MDEVGSLKAWCMENPEASLWCGTTRNMPEVRSIFYRIKQLRFADRPDYDYIRDQLTTLLQKEEGTQSSLDTKTSLVLSPSPIETHVAFDICV